MEKLLEWAVVSHTDLQQGHDPEMLYGHDQGIHIELLIAKGQKHHQQVIAGTLTEIVLLEEGQEPHLVATALL